MSEIVGLNLESMQDNQRYVRRLKEMVGDEPQVNVETDSSYNNRPQAGYEAATQSNVGARHKQEISSVYGNCQQALC